MKKIINIFLVAVLALTAAACSHKTEVAAFDGEAAEKALDKASKSGATQEDYAQVLAYMDAALNSIEGVVGKAMEAESDDDLNAIEKDYDEIMKSCGKQLSSMGQLMEHVKLDETNKAEFERITKRAESIMLEMAQVGRRYANSHSSLPGGAPLSSGSQNSSN